MVAVVPFDPGRAPERLARSAHACLEAVEAEERPGDDPVPWERRRLDWGRVEAEERVPR